MEDAKQNLESRIFIAFEPIFCKMAYVYVIKGPGDIQK